MNINCICVNAIITMYVTMHVCMYAVIYYSTRIAQFKVTISWNHYFLRNIQVWNVAGWVITFTYYSYN